MRYALREVVYPLRLTLYALRSRGNALHFALCAMRCVAM
jgi:hypothetical protein